MFPNSPHASVPSCLTMAATALTLNLAPLFLATPGWAQTDPAARSNAQQLLDQFENMARSELNPLLQALAEIQPDELSPREALEVLYRLKGLEQK